jgi:flagellar basal-body rod modification protein FlgD
MSLTNADVGTYPITWDGLTDAKTTKAAGKYTFTVTAQWRHHADRHALQLAAVASVSTGSGGVKLNTSLGHFSMSDVKEVL